MNQPWKHLRFSFLAIALAGVLLAGCSQTPERPDASTASDTSFETLSERQRQRYLSALDAAAEGDYPGATDRLHQLSQEQPKHPGIWLNLAAIYYQSNRPEQSREALAQARRLEPDNALIDNLEGSLALDDGDVESAEAHFRRAVTRNNGLAEAHYNLALLYDTYYQKLAPAIEHYQMYLELIPEDDQTTARWIEQLQRSLERQ